MNQVVKILMERDGMSEEDAKDTVRAVKQDIMDAIMEEDYDLVEDILSSDLGLEMDYIFDIL